MFQLEIYEYNLSTIEINTIYSNTFQKKNQNEANEVIESLSTEENIEIKFLKIKNSLKFPLITQYLDLVKDNNFYIFVSEFFGDSLDTIIDTKLNEKTYFKQDEIIRIAYQVLLALNYLENKGIILRYLEPRRLLLNNDNSLKLRNYISDIMFSPQQLKYINNFRYLSPELIFYNDINHNIKSAIWSLGIILLELLLNIQNINLYQDFFKYLGTNQFIKDYIELLEKYKDSSVFNKSEKIFDIHDKDTKRLLELFLNGDLSKKIEVSSDFKDFLQSCLFVDPSKRKDSATLLHHNLFAHLNKNLFCKSLYYICPVDKDTLVSFYSKDEIRQKQSNSIDNYEIFKNIFKIDVLLFLKKKGIIDYKPMILKIPSYFRFNQASTIETTTVMIQNSTKNEFEKLFDGDHQNDHFYEGNLISIGNYIINLPSDYEKENLLLDSFLKNSIFDMQLIVSDKYSSNISDSSSEISAKDGVSVKSSDSKLITSKIANNEKIKEINYYFKLKYIIRNIITQTNVFKKDELLSEIKKNGYYIPSNFRATIYKIILEADLINDNEVTETTSLYENHSYASKEMKQILKDILRCEDYDPLFKTKEGKIMLKQIFQALIYNQEDFFYVQGMESICSAFVKLFYPNIDTSYQVFFRFIKKMLFQFFDTKKKSVNNLAFNHLLIARLIAFFDPELYIYLKDISFLDEQFSVNWILTLFSQSFKFDAVYKIWDLFLLENINMFYLVIVYILKHNRLIILENSKDFILSGFREMTENLKPEKILMEVIQMKKMIPDSLIPIVSDFSEEIVSELSKSDYFKFRWWDLCNFNTNSYLLPIINLDDVITNIQNLCFIDVRLKADFEQKKIKDSINFNLTQKMNIENLIKSFHNLKNSHKMFVIIGDKRTDYYDISQILLKNKIKYLTILKGGIDIVYTDEISLIDQRKIK